jgi:hypothetical protein
VIIPGKNNLINILLSTFWDPRTMHYTRTFHTEPEETKVMPKEPCKYLCKLDGDFCKNRSCREYDLCPTYIKQKDKESESYPSEKQSEKKKPKQHEEEFGYYNSW